MMDRIKPLVQTAHYVAEHDPLLEYFTSLSYHFLSDEVPDGPVLDDDGNIVLNENGQELMTCYTVTLAPQQFATKYFKGEVNMEREKKYLASVEVMDTLKAFHLDVDKFWYLCIGIQDVVEDYAKSASVSYKWVKEELNDFEEHLGKLDRFGKFDNTGVLTLKVGEKSLRIDNPDTLEVIKEAVHLWLGQNEHSRYFRCFPIGCKWGQLKPIYKIALFNKFLAWFLEDKVADKNLKASKDKSLLISRMIFVLGISDDESFFEEYKDNGKRLNYLKNYIKKYKGVKIACFLRDYSSQSPIGVIQEVEL